jgi:hypothetical protein
MAPITFPDRETEKRALAFLLGRFSGRVLKTGEHQFNDRREVPDNEVSAFTGT